MYYCPDSSPGPGPLSEAEADDGVPRLRSCIVPYPHLRRIQSRPQIQLLHGGLG